MGSRDWDHRDAMDDKAARERAEKAEREVRELKARAIHAELVADRLRDEHERAEKAERERDEALKEVERLAHAIVKHHGPLCNCALCVDLREGAEKGEK